MFVVGPPGAGKTVTLTALSERGALEQNTQVSDAATAQEIADKVTLEWRPEHSREPR